MSSLSGSKTGFVVLSNTTTDIGLVSRSMNNSLNVSLGLLVIAAMLALIHLGFQLAPVEDTLEDPNAAAATIEKPRILICEADSREAEASQKQPTARQPEATRTRAEDSAKEETPRHNPNEWMYDMLA